MMTYNLGFFCVSFLKSTRYLILISLQGTEHKYTAEKFSPVTNAAVGISLVLSVLALPLLKDSWEDLANFIKSSNILEFKSDLKI